MTRLGRAVLLAVSLLMAVPAAAVAQPKADAAELDEATKMFEQGSKLFLEKRYQEALEVLERSFRIHPSPNSLLLIARCERDLGRLEYAARHFSEVISTADARVSAGEAQYEKTAEAARREGADVRQLLGTVRIRVKGAPEGAPVETPYVRALLAADGTAELVHRAGDVRVTIRLPDGRSLARTVTVRARAWSDVELDASTPRSTSETKVRKPEPAPPVEAERASAPAWMVPTGIVLTGIGVVGFGGFAYFGSRSRSTYEDLERDCGTSCSTDAQRERADEGKRDQTIANVSLAVGAVTLAAGAVLLIISASDGSSSKTGSSARILAGQPFSF